ncbi:MAG: Uncharacterised protein [Methanobacteriota archaeon]|nr:MAG: Uncharacterised protein [Euryarchaeota archaeon]
MPSSESREKLLIIWLILSSFGIMFAVLSWMQESDLIPDEMGPWKGFLALLTGFVLYGVVAHNITGGPGDK